LGEADKKESKDQTPEEMMLDAVGCTANVVYINKKTKKIYVSNAGDSRCVMCKGGKAVEMSVDHKPNDEGERARIEAAGSEVNAEGRVDGNLNLSRSLGDLKSKHRPHLPAEEQAITANPDTYVFDLTDDLDFILMGCDGIWEKNDNEKAV
jgi:serine/threonine protein phosphatase PrpC